MVNCNYNFTARYDALKVQNEASSSEELEKELGNLKQRYKKLKVLNYPQAPSSFDIFLFFFSFYHLGLYVKLNC